MIVDVSRIKMISCKHSGFLNARHPYCKMFVGKRLLLCEVHLHFEFLVRNWSYFYISDFFVTTWITRFCNNMFIVGIKVELALKYGGWVALNLFCKLYLILCLSRQKSSSRRTTIKKRSLLLHTHRQSPFSRAVDSWNGQG